MAESVNVGAEKSATDATKDTGVVFQPVPQPALVADGLVEGTTDAGEQLAALPSWAAAELFRAEGGFARVWVELAGAQMTRDAEVRRRLAAAPEWRAAVEVHKEFTRDTLGRMAEAVDRCLDLQREMVGRVVAASRQEQARRAGRRKAYRPRRGARAAREVPTSERAAS